MTKREKIEELKEQIRYNQTRHAHLVYYGTAAQYASVGERIEELREQLAALEAEERDEGHEPREVK